MWEVVSAPSDSRDTRVGQTARYAPRIALPLANVGQSSQHSIVNQRIPMQPIAIEYRLQVHRTAERRTTRPVACVEYYL
jgi:hypothetical protein